MNAPAISIHPGQIWQDLDPRMTGRTIVVLEVTDDKALVRSYLPDRGAYGQRHRIAIARLRPQGRRGFMLVKDPVAPSPEL